MKKFLTLMLGLGLAIGTVGTTFAADEKPATTEKKPKKAKKAKKPASEPGTPSTPSK